MQVFRRHYAKPANTGSKMVLNCGILSLNDEKGELMIYEIIAYRMYIACM
ncbi:hypothetical protein SAMN05216311_10922 [Chitinophaga sp. CF418]|nr:hypothetical protein SAMN05216311_10922 [Chitinophaga sp. CF418]